MIVVLDARCLVRWTATDADERHHRTRLEYLLECVTRDRGRIVLPTPVVAELLVRTAQATQEWLSAMERKSAVVIAPFDMRAAVETAALDASAFTAGKKRGARKDPWQQVKVDRQIIGIALARRATLLVTDDGGMRTTAQESGLQVAGLEDLPLPDSARQGQLPLQPQRAADVVEERPSV